MKWWKNLPQAGNNPNDETDDDSTSNGPERSSADGQDSSDDDEMAAAEVKIQVPSTFHGKHNEVVIYWVDRYETIGAYNG